MPRRGTDAVWRSPTIGFSVVIRGGFNSAYCVKLHTDGVERWSGDWIEGYPSGGEVIPLVLASLALAWNAPVEELFNIPSQPRKL